MKTINKYNETSVIIALGRRGSGKSYLLKKIADTYPRVLVLDVMHDKLYDDDEYYKIYDFQTLKDLMLISGYKKEFKYVYRFSENSANIDEEFEQICRMVYFRQNMLLVIEEIQTFTNTNVDGLPYALKDLLLKGRHKKIALGFTTQRPALLNKTIISQNDYVFCGNLQAKSDIDYIAFHTGINKDDIQNLNEREFIISSIYEKNSKIIKNDNI